MASIQYLDSVWQKWLELMFKNTTYKSMTVIHQRSYLRIDMQFMSDIKFRRRVGAKQWCN